MKRNNREESELDSGYIWSYYYGFGFMDDYGSFVNAYSDKTVPWNPPF